MTPKASAQPISAPSGTTSDAKLGPTDMSRQTETRANLRAPLDQLPAMEALAAMVAGQVAAVQSITAVIPAIDAAATACASALRNGGRLIYVAAGSSALMGMADALELGGTFGISPEQIVVLMAGGFPQDSRMPGASEDDATAALADLHRDAPALSANDCVIAISASGATPYPLSVVMAAKSTGATVISIANTAQSPLLNAADIAIHLATPPEVLAGSTRLGAATAQKTCLNMISTQMAVYLGHIHNGLMVGVKADNMKLVARAAAIVAEIAEVDMATAQSALAAAQGDVKLAIFIAKDMEISVAKALLFAHHGVLRSALGAGE